ncbi:RAP protein [Plasmodium gonderi]|uniref:RAP protein n=1 Tax=Plasmodium gonderi TaxID=77519 RepID=A0A1Y1JEQ3_PLAGO|nr:RAP protein [Plasmodium gonderi]GAW78913.1 RAP protein [Plasmodium gonderi]
MTIFANSLLLIAYLIYLLLIAFLLTKETYSVVIKKSSFLKTKQDGNYNFVKKLFKRRNLFQALESNGEENRCVWRKKSHYYHHQDGKNKKGSNHQYCHNSEFIDKFNKRNFFIKPSFSAKCKQSKLWTERNEQGIVHEEEILEKVDSIDAQIGNIVCERTNDSTLQRMKQSHDYIGQTTNKNEFDLVNDYILLKKNRKTIKELMEEGIWGAPKENIKMIRERTNKKINWNYILKKNNELLNDNVDKIYKGIYNKENIEDIFFIFDTNPYNYLNITMSVFSLYKFTTAYLNERKIRMNSSFKGKKVSLLGSSHNSDKICSCGVEEEKLSVTDHTNKGMLTFGYDDNSYEEVDDGDILKMKEERKRLYYITRNRNFLRVVGSINKHLKIIYKIFSTNEKLTSYEKNKDMYKFIPYINIKDIITILKCFCILKYDHTNIFKYIYFFLVFFMDKFDMTLLCEAVYLCNIKKIYIKSLFLNFSKHLLAYLQRISLTPSRNDIDLISENFGDKVHPNINNRDDDLDKVESKGDADSERRERTAVTDESLVKSHVDSNEDIKKVNSEECTYSLYDQVNIDNFYKNMKKNMNNENPEPDIFISSPFHMKDLMYSIYHLANYSCLDSSLDDLEKEKAYANEHVKKYGPEDLRHTRMRFVEGSQMSPSPITGESLNEATKHESTKEEINERGEARRRPVNLYAYCLCTLCKFPYTNLSILNIIASEVMKNADELSIEELILSFHSLATLEFNSTKLLNILFVSIIKKLHLLDYRNNQLIVKLVRALYLLDEELSEERGDCNSRIDEKQPKNFTSRLKQIKTLILYFLSKMILKNRNNYTPIELVDIIRYMSALTYIDKELFNFVYDLPFLKSLNEETLNHYKNSVYFNQSYYAYTKDSSVNTPIEIMVCKLYQSYLSYSMYTDTHSDREVEESTIIQRIHAENDKVKTFRFGEEPLKLFKQTYLNNMRIISYSSSSLHYEIADIIQKDLKIPCHVEYITENGLLIDIAILRDDLINNNYSFKNFQNIAIEVNGPFHYKTRSYRGGYPPLNTKTVVKRRLLEHDKWQVISLPFWEIKPWFSKSRKENFILRMLPDNLKSFFNKNN